MGGALEKAAKKALFRSCCGCLHHVDGHQHRNRRTHILHTASRNSSPASSPPEYLTSSCKKMSSSSSSPHQANSSIISSSSPSSSTNNKNLCTICLDPLNYGGAGTSPPGQAIFTAQCSHAFHFACISSNVRHGSITCPICRARWTHLPRNLKPNDNNSGDPVLRILDDSIATSRAHRRSFLLSPMYDAGVEPDAEQLPRLSFSLLPASETHHRRHHGMTTPSLNSAATYLNVKLSQQPPIDLVLIASPNGPHLRLMKQAMALVVFSLRPVDRLAVVTHHSSSAAARVFPLRRMSSYGKRTALRIVDRLSYTWHAESPSMEVLKKGVKVLEDRAHKNPQSCIFHLTDNTCYEPFDAEVPFAIQRFNVGFGSAMHEFEDFLARALGGGVRNVRLRIGDAARFFAIGELRGGEERNFPLAVSGLDGAEQRPTILVEYSFVECGDDDDGDDDGRVRTGEVFVGFEEKGDDGDDVVRGGEAVAVDGGSRISSAECTNWDYHDALMARRWAKHLHGGYRP